MGKIILVTGGARSGKSSYALGLGRAMPGPRVFIATCPVTDDEMERRIEKHRRERGGGEWETVEEGTDLAGAIRGAEGAAVIVVDCLTLWVNNLIYEAEKESREVTEEEVAALSAEVIGACRDVSGTVIFVTNEVGMGIVPGDGVSRRYRDLVGRCNQTIAAGADAAALVVCGIATIIKGEI